MAADYPVRYAKGYETSDDVVREDLMAEAVAAAKAAKVAVVFAGLPDTFESEATIGSTCGCRTARMP